MPDEDRGKCVGLDWQIDEAERAIDYLQGRTKKDPKFALLTGILHDGRVMYDIQQPYVEKLMNVPLDKLRHEDDVFDLLDGAQWRTKVSKMLPDAVRCYESICGEDGKECLEPRGREKLLTCLGGIRHEYQSTKEREKTIASMGPKGKDLMREYLGDDNAVAVDTHVRRWVCEEAKLYCPTRQLTGRAYQEEYNHTRDVLREAADDCDIKPIVLQVAAWINGVCRNRNYNPVFLGDGHTIMCQKGKMGKGFKPIDIYEEPD